MMLRTNFLSRIKKVCNTAALVPRILRGNEQRITPVSCAAVKKSPKSTKATDEGTHETNQKDNDDATVMKKPSLDKNIEVINVSDINEPIGPLVNMQRALKKSQYEKCQRIIEKAFGKEEVEEPELTEHYFSKGVDIEQTKQEIIKSEQLNLAESWITDDRTQFAFFETASKLEEVPDKLTDKLKAESKIVDADLSENMKTDNSIQFEMFKTLEEEPEKLTAPESMVKTEPKIIDTDLSENVTDERMTAERTQFAMFKTSPKLEEVHEQLTAKESIVNAEPKILDADLSENMITTERTQFALFKTSPELKEEPEKITAPESTVKVEPKILDADLSENMITTERTQFALFNTSCKLEEVPENLTAKESAVKTQPKILETSLSENMITNKRTQLAMFKMSPELQEEPEKMTAPEFMVKAEPKILDTDLLDNMLTDERITDERTQCAMFKTSPKLEEVHEKHTMKESVVKTQPKILDTDILQNIVTDERLQFALFKASCKLEEVPERLMTKESAVKSEPKILDTGLSENLITNKMTAPESMVKAEPEILDTVLIDNMITDEKIANERTQSAMFKTTPKLKEVHEKLTMKESVVKTQPKILDTDILENIINDEKIQFAMFETSPKLEEVPEKLTAKETVVKTEPKILNTDPDEGFVPMKPTMNQRLMSARTPDDLIKGTENNKDLTNENLHLDETITKEEVDKYVHNHENLEKTLYETHEESKQNAAHTIDIGETKKEQDEPPVINKCNSHIPSLERKTDLSILKRIYLPNTADTDIFVDSDKKFNQILDTYLHRPVRNNTFVNTTTAKEEKEQLTQKVEHIEETPLVEAQKQPIEGFSITPRVLGELEQAYRWIKNKHVNLMAGKKSDTGELDEAAKRCLDSPVGQIDEALLNELEKLGIPITTPNQPRSPAIDDNRVQMDTLRKCVHSDKGMHPGQPMSLNNQEKLLPDKDAEAKELAMKLAAEEEAESLAIYPSHTHIDKNYDIRLEEIDDLETETPELKQPGIHTHRTTHAAQVKPGQIPFMAATDILMREPPKWVPCQNPKLYMNQTEINEPNKKLKTQQFYAKPDLEGTKEALTESKVEESPVTTPWNPFAKAGYRYVVQTDKSTLCNKRLKKSYAKGREKPLYYQSSTANSMWNSQRKPEVKYSRKSISKPTDKAHTYLSMNLTNRVLPSKNQTLNARLNTADEQIQKDVKAAKEINDEKLFSPLSIPEEDPVPKPETNYMNPPPLQQHYKINSNVSDGIWDENVDALTPKVKMEDNRLPEELTKKQLDPRYVLTYNETCPISPKPEPSRLMKSTEAVYEQDTKPKELNLSNLPKLPKLNEDVSLSELLKRVRERNRIIECRNDLKALGVEVDPIQAQVGKCPKKAPQCPPTAPRSPPANPVPPPLFGLPTPPRRPPSCKPRKPRTRKCSSCDMDLSSSLRLGPEFNVPIAEMQAEMVCEMKDIGAEVCATRLKAELTLEVIEKLQTLGKVLGRLLRQGRAHNMFDIGSIVSTSHPGHRTMLARDYAPWTPIPSWPAPKPPCKRKPPCQAGCPSCPPPRGKMNPDPPCNLKPCEGFPKKSFSLIDCFAVSVGENRVYDIGQF
ncbi:uncharacterized protein LOC111351420 [Spodoptera litura]|uniref:Uncharacterized protein LOC111351420 n=1 Tax=Spodoptera litura TaxID=69820 RepID=A0A9J7DYU8_SPOLT|nr:uncharacterized protein LOC111351420 [Spodoptera litura]